MNPKDILKNIDDFNIDKIILAKEDVSELEIERVKRKIKIRVNNKRRKKRKIAITAAIISIIVFIGNPILAANIPSIKKFYESIGIFEKYKNYKEYIGMEKESNGYKVELIELVGSKNNIVVALKIESPKKYERDLLKDNYIIDIVCKDEKGQEYGSFGGRGDLYYLDDYTAILKGKINSNNDEYKEKSKINISVNKLENDIMKVDFELNVDFTESFKKSKKLSLEKDINDYWSLREFSTDLVGSKIIINAKRYKHNEEYYNSLNYEEQQKINKEIYGEDYNKYGLYFLQVDNVLYTQDVGLGEDSQWGCDFKCNYDDIENAKEVNLVEIIKIDEPKEKEVTKVKYNKKDKVKMYPEIMVTGSGKKAEINKVEFSENNSSLKFYLNSEFDPSNIFLSLFLDCIYGDTGKQLNNPTIYKEGDNKYILEYSDIGTCDEYNLIFYDNGVELDDKYNMNKIKLK